MTVTSLPEHSTRKGENELCKKFWPVSDLKQRKYNEPGFVTGVAEQRYGISGA
jgi:hypothetical protein